MFRGLHLDYVPSLNKEYRIMKNANKIITIANKANHFFIEVGMVSFFITKIAPSENAIIMKIILMVGSMLLFTSDMKHDSELPYTRHYGSCP